MAENFETDAESEKLGAQTSPSSSASGAKVLARWKDVVLTIQDFDNICSKFILADKVHQFELQSPRGKWIVEELVLRGLCPKPLFVVLVLNGTTGAVLSGRVFRRVSAANVLAAVNEATQVHGYPQEIMMEWALPFRRAD